MAESYVKLFNTITTSTIWEAPHATRIVWVTMLALADKRGEVQASVPGLARVANVSLDECEAALAAFMAPDRYSRTEAHEGRRIERVDGGWRLLNHRKYREKLDHESGLERRREWDRVNRPSGAARKPASPTQSDASPTQSDAVRRSPTHTDADTDTEQKLYTHHGKKLAREARSGVCEPESAQGDHPVDDPPNAKPRPEVQAAIALRRRGLRITASNPDLIDALQAGVTVLALADMADAYPDKPAGYVIAAARRQHAEGAHAPPDQPRQRAGPAAPISKTGAAFAALNLAANTLDPMPDDRHPAAALVPRSDPARPVALAHA